MSHTGILLTFSQLNCFVFTLNLFIPFETPRRSKVSKNYICSDLAHVISIILVVQKKFSLIKINTHILLCLHIRPGSCVIEDNGCVLAEAMLPSTGQSWQCTLPVLTATKEP